MCETISKDPIYCNSGIMLHYIETEKWIDGTIITSANDTLLCDNLIYISENNKYYVLSSFLEGKSLNAKVFGALGNGTTDDSIAIQKMMDFAWKIRDIGIYTNIYFPRGKYKITSMIQVPNRVSISGDGINASVIFTENNHDMFHFREVKNVINTINNAVNTLYTKVSNISFYGINNENVISSLNPIEGNNGLVFMDMVKIELDSVSVRGLLHSALYFHNVYYIKLKSVNVEWNKKGLVASSCTSIQSLNCEFRLNGQGIYLYKTYAFSFINPLIENNVLQLDPTIDYDLNPSEASSIGILFYESWGGSVFGGYFESQIIDVYYFSSFNINIGNSFFCNVQPKDLPVEPPIQEDPQEEPLILYMPANTIFINNNSHENEIYGNSYSVNGVAPLQQDMRMFIAPDSHNNVIKINKKIDFENWQLVNAWIFEEFDENNILEKSPRVICESSNIEILHGKRKPISGIFFGDVNRRPSNPQVGFLYFNVSNAKIEFFDGVEWLVT